MKASPHSLWGLALLVLVVGVANTWWASHQKQRLGAQVAALAGPGDLHMVASETCGVCIVARRWFTEHRVHFTECLIEQDADCRAAYERWGAPGTPVMVVRGQPQLGFSPELLRRALERAS